MNPTRIPNATREMGPPKDHDSERDGPIRHLAVRDESHCGVHFIVSACETEAEEAGWLLAGGRVHAGLSVPQQPVMNMRVAMPGEDAPPVFTLRHTGCAEFPNRIRLEGFYPAQTEGSIPSFKAFADHDNGGDDLPSATAECMRAVIRAAEKFRGSLPEAREKG